MCLSFFPKYLHYKYHSSKFKSQAQYVFPRIIPVLEFNLPSNLTHSLCWCHCSIYDVIASLLLNKAAKMETSVPYKGVSYKTRKKTMLFKDSSREKRCWGLSFSIYNYAHKWRTYAKASYRQAVE